MVEIREVKSRSELKQFIQFYYDLYRGCDCAVPFLYFDEMATLRSDKNPSFECCEAQYFLAYKDGKIVGRVAAIINRRANERWNCHQVRFGWFDFIDDLEVSTALLKAVEDWGRERGMVEMAGPLGFIDTDREGMLVEGFDQLASMYVNYNYPYYPRHIEQMSGFKKDNDYVECKVKVPEIVPEKFVKVTDMVRRRYGLKVHKFTRHELIEEGYGRKVFDLLNATYARLYQDSRPESRDGHYGRGKDGGLRHHLPVILTGSAEDPRRSPVPVRLVACAEDPEMAQDTDCRPAAYRCAARIQNQGCQCADLQRPDTLLPAIQFRVCRNGTDDGDQ